MPIWYNILDHSIDVSDWSPVFNGDTPFSTHSHSDFSPSSEVATTQQTDSVAHKLKPRSFHKSTYLQVHFADFHPSVNHAWPSKTLGLINKKNLVLELIQENLIENSIQDGLPYILITHSLCSTTLAYPKWPYISLKANMC